MNITNIEASLKHGRLFTGKWIIILRFGLGVGLLFPFLTILMLIITLTIGMDWTYEMIFSMIGGNIFGLCILLVYILCIVRNEKLKQKISLWLENSVQVKAYSRSIGSVRLGIQPKQVKIQVDFMIDGKQYSRVSAGKMLGGGPEGYHKIWAYYADREIDILYSEKYDEVLILKDNQH